VVKWGWIVAACLLAGWAAARRHRQSRWFQVAELAAIAGALLIGFGVVHLPKLETLLENAGTTLGSWTYLLVGALAFAETGAFLGFIAPGETAVIVGGLVAGQGKISLIVLIAIVWVCAVLGDLTSYALGRRLGRAWLVRHGKRLQITDERMDQVQGFFERRGNVTILVGRFLGFVRPLLPFVAGASRMPLGRYLRFDVLAAGAWAVTFSVLGYVFWRSFDKLTTYVSRGLFALGTFVALVVAVVALVQLRRDPEKRAAVRAWLDARSDRPGWRYVARAAGPLWRRAGRPLATGLDATARFATGPLGLELMALLTLLATGAFAFLLLGHVIRENPQPAIDRWAFDVADRLQSDMLVDVAKVVTEIGSYPVVLVAALGTAAWALWRRRPFDAGALVVGVLLTDLAVHAAKAAYDRPRPSGSLVETTLSAYPSGHALQAVTLVACATVLVRGGSGWAIRIAAITVAWVLVAVVAVTRVYLRAHYLTDVLGGVALGTALWALLGVLVLIVYLTIDIYKPRRKYVRPDGGVQHPRRPGAAADPRAPRSR
jgi:membrane protein DedA with SNARE-associated domain/membrane-associated phospholipid phosphatase